MIKIIPGEIIETLTPSPDMKVMRTQILDIATREPIDYFEFVSIWTSYKKDQKLPENQRRLRITNKLRMKNVKNKMIAVTLKTKNTDSGKQIERTEMALRRLLVKAGRYELSSVIEAMAAQENYDKTKTVSTS